MVSDSCSLQDRVSILWSHRVIQGFSATSCHQGLAYRAHCVLSYLLCGELSCHLELEGPLRSQAFQLATSYSCGSSTSRFNPNESCRPSTYLKSSVAVQNLKLTGRSKQPVDLVAYQREMLLDQQLPLTGSFEGWALISCFTHSKPPVGPASGDFNVIFFSP